jgi:hypothetical protein
MFWTRVEGFGSLGMPSILSYLHILYSLDEEEANVLNFELDKLNLHMKHQVLKVILSFFSFFILLIKKKKKHVNFYVGSQV